jgi:hypothetical protein
MPSAEKGAEKAGLGYRCSSCQPQLNVIVAVAAQVWPVVFVPCAMAVLWFRKHAPTTAEDATVGVATSMPNSFHA